MSKTLPHMEVARAPLWLVGLITVVALAGLPRLAMDQGYQLASDHPLVQLNQRVRGSTLSDQAMGVVVWSNRSLLNADGVRDIEAAREAVAAIPYLEHVRAVTRAPVLASQDGVLVVTTPLWPPPLDEGGWTEARKEVFADPFIPGQLINDQGDTTVIVGWVRSLTADQALAALAASSVAGPQASDGPLESAVRKEIAQARLAVGLGEVAGPPDLVIAQRLRALASVGSRSEGGAPPDIQAGLEDWIARAEFIAQDPEAEVSRLLGERVDGLVLTTGTRAAPFGSKLVESGLQAQYPVAFLLGLVGFLCAGFGFIAHGRGVLAGLGAILAAIATLGATLGTLGWLGIPADPLSILGSLAGVVWTLALVMQAPWTPRALGRAGLVLGLPLLLLSPLGPCGSLWVAAALGLGLALLFGATCSGWAPMAGGRSPQPLQAPVPWFLKDGSRDLGFVAVALVLFALSLSLSPPGGGDTSRLLAGRHVITGQETRGLGAAIVRDRLGGVPPVFLVAEGNEPGHFADPTAIAHLSEQVEQLRDGKEVSAAWGWPDLIGHLHRRVAGVDKGSMPSHRDAVEQYLLLLGRPQDTRSFVSRDLDLALARLNLSNAGAKRAGRLYDRFPAEGEGPFLAGAALEWTLASREQSRALLLSLVLGCLVFLPLVGWTGAHGRRERLRVGLAVFCYAMLWSGLALIFGDVSGRGGPESWVGAALVAGVGVQVVMSHRRHDRTALALLLGAGGLPLFFTPVLPLVQLAAVLVTGSLLLLMWQKPMDFSKL